MIPRIVTVSAAIAISGIAMRQYRTQRAAPMRTMTTIPALSWGCGGWIGMETPGTCCLRDELSSPARAQPPARWPGRPSHTGCRDLSDNGYEEGLCKILQAR